MKFVDDDDDEAQPN